MGLTGFCSYLNDALGFSSALQLLSHWLSTGTILPPKGHLAVAQDIVFDCHTQGCGRED